MAASMDSRERFEQITADLPDGRDYPIVISVIPILTLEIDACLSGSCTEWYFNIWITICLKETIRRLTNKK